MRAGGQITQRPILEMFVLLINPLLSTISEAMFL